MGSTFANDLASMQDLSMENSIGIHLQSNHYPPVPLSMVQPCIDAINAYWDNDLNCEIELPEPITWRGKSSAPAHAIVEAHHLDSWLEIEDDFTDMDSE